MAASGWLELSDLSLHEQSSSAAPKAPFVRGRLNGSWFTPEGSVEGEITAPPAVDPAYVQGWVWLPARAFFAESSTQAPLTPFIRGYLDLATGVFLPTGPLIHEAPASGR